MGMVGCLWFAKEWFAKERFALNACQKPATKSYAPAAFAVVAATPGFTIAAATRPANTNPIATVQT
jgi:hypothetical protein